MQARKMRKLEAAETIKKQKRGDTTATGISPRINRWIWTHCAFRIQ